MSYTIEYNRQFIKTKNGYIPCVLFGDNNVYEGSGRNERRYRHWSIFQNWVDVSEEYMLEEVKKMFSLYNENWKKGSNWVTNEGMLRWVKNGCRSAATLEEIIKYNGLIFPVLATIHYYPNNDFNAKEINRNIKTNQDLEEWIKEYKQFKLNNGCKDCFPIINFGIETIKSPTKNSVMSNNSLNSNGKEIKDTDLYALKAPISKWGYLCQITKPDERISFCTDITQSKVFTYGEIKELIKLFGDMYLVGNMPLSSFKLVKANKVFMQYYLIKFVSGVYKNNFIGSKNKRGGYTITYSSKGAKKLTLKQAEKLVEELRVRGFLKDNDVEIVKYEKDGRN